MCWSEDKWILPNGELKQHEEGLLPIGQPCLVHNMLIALFDNNNTKFAATVKVSRIYAWDCSF